MVEEIKDRWPSRPAEPDWDLVKLGLKNMSEVMRQMEFSEFRGGQEPVIMSIMSQLDTICILPTGTGKTACFVIPTLCLNWRTIVFSPLVALMRDQIKSLHARGIEAAAMSGMQTDGENADAARRWAEGELNFLYVAPERLHNTTFKHAVGAVPPDFVVLDEAHTLSQWSDNFRSSYCKVGDFIKEHNPKCVAAFTATCPKQVDEDIRRVLGLTQAKKLIHYPRRKNLKLKSEELTSDYTLCDTVRDVNGSTIVYCATINKVEAMAEMLSKNLQQEVSFFHGDLSVGTKRYTQDAFMDGHVRVMVATNAFGMGVDKADIRAVIHRDIPGTVEALAQETGRAGRDGLDALCMTYYAKDSYNTQQFFLQSGHPPAKDIQRAYGALQRMSDSAGVCRVTGDKLAQEANISPISIYAVFETLKGANVIDRTRVDKKICRVRETQKMVPEEDQRFYDWMHLANQLAVPTPDGFLEFDLEEFTETVGLTYPTVRKWFKQWTQEKYIRFVDPYTGSETRIIGDLSQVDFARLSEKRELAYRKLDDVVTYVNLPDDEKHGYIEDYFEVHD